MALAPKSSPRRFDVLQDRLDELAKQKKATARRAATYENLDQVSALQQITAVRSEPILERYQFPFLARSGEELRAKLLEEIADLPPTSRGIANKPFRTKIGIISDLFLYKSFEGLADFRPIYPSNYQQHHDIDILLLVSTWRGIDGTSWRGVTSRISETRERLFDQILPFYRSLNIPIVFYSKEDPPNYNHFLPFARQADYVFTSAAEMVPKYERDCPEAKRIGVLPFGINPANHSPIGSQQGNVHRVVPFAGSWFNHKYRERSRWGRGILDAVTAASNYDLLIFDRNSELRDPRYRFPNRYANAVTSAIDHQPLLDIQRKVDISINLNSVSNSTSMFANRAIELQAQGTVVLSNYNVGLNSRYPHVHISNGFTDTLATLNTLTEPQIRELQAAGLRSVFSNDLALMRVAKIIETVGLSGDVDEPRVVVIKHSADERLNRDIAQQTYSNVTGVVDASTTPTAVETRNFADIVVHFDAGYEYASTHIEDLVNAFRYTDAVAVEKILPAGTEQSLSTRHSYGPVSMLKVAGAEFIGEIPAGITAQPGYRIDEIGIRPRSESVALSVVDTSSKQPPVLSVVVPIYNNGQHLLYKCIASLRRSSIFEQMEVVLVDDGSTDVSTLDALKKLERELDWVQVYRFEPGGSGSASRPRNKGLEIASCDYITYLDPDNEALNDAYVRLLHTVVESEVDFAVADMTRWRGKNSSVRYTRFLRDRLDINGHVGRGGAQALVDMKFMPISIQAIVARTKWLRDIGITQPVGAVGQDSYFFQQMLYYANEFAIVPRAAHTYYAQVESSVVNTVNAKFFDKYLPLESARSQWLTEVGLLDAYRETRMETFFTGWYLRKLPQVPEDQRALAIKTIAELGRMYGDYDWKSDAAREFWTTTVSEIEPPDASGEN